MLVDAAARQSLIANLPRGGVGAEIGVFQGDFSAALLARTSPTEMYLIDPWVSVDTGVYRQALYGVDQKTQTDMDGIYEGVMRRFSPMIAEGRVKVHRATSEVALAALPDSSLDWVYIDGDHTYGAALLDLRLGLMKVRRGGLICGDDYTRQGWWGDGVVRAVHEFLHEACSRTLVHFVMDTQFMIRVVS